MLETLFILATSFGTIEPNPDRAYLIFDVIVVPAESPQARWLGFGRNRRNDRTIHLPADESIVEVKPGRYELFHVDFSVDPYSRGGRRTQYFENGPVFEMKAGTIYLLGRIELHETGFQRYEVVFADNLELIQDACRKAPNVFEKFAVSTFGQLPDQMITCSTNESSASHTFEVTAFVR